MCCIFNWQLNQLNCFIKFLGSHSWTLFVLYIAKSWYLYQIEGSAVPHFYHGYTVQGTSISSRSLWGRLCRLRRNYPCVVQFSVSMPAILKSVLYNIPKWYFHNTSDYISTPPNIKTEVSTMAHEKFGILILHCFSNLILFHSLYSNWNFISAALEYVTMVLSKSSISSFTLWGNSTRSLWDLTFFV